ncbi:alpha/beta hydrolase [Saccharopolyspora sp. HNM0983]|uniref:Acyl-CoA:diacylglycerol acyltransferase n=1 Tax=Saccharopolyspora montiporae TaxID=2781240 RepID=A0A929G066_9PSEU|nr:alpha/beta hydrolase-fold protein [Saccharopolyspora sp. HNM0983]MBE9374497.1 alpha/beta hydrolase [Saccharopolyspora sp. HNM0983]
MRHGDSGESRFLSRRSVLSAGVAGAAALGLGLSGDAASLPLEKVEPLANRTNVSVEQVYSQARRRDVDLVTMYPEGVAPQHLPVCLMLHGRFGDARKSVGALPSWLTNSVHRGRIPPYVFLAVDGGGNSYWHDRGGDDPMQMLLDEVPSWLVERGLGGPHGEPAAAAGISMGGFGALLYTRQRIADGHPPTATAVVSPALITDWGRMRKRRAFANAQEWAAMDPLRHVDELGDVPLGVWCGTNDRFIDGTREFIRRADPKVASTTPGGHNSRYYRKALPELVNFVGDELADSAEPEAAAAR